MGASGRCLCGAVSYTADGIETHFHSCHCEMCRRWSGGPAFAAKVDSIVFQGEENIGRFQSSEWAERGFCQRCGGNLFYRLKEADQYIVWLGTFDDQSPFKLSGEIFVDEKPPGYALAGDHQRLTGKQFFASLQKGEE